MRFEGTIKINAPRTFVWATLMQESVFEQIAPGVTNVQAVVPGERYLVDVGVPFGDAPTIIQAEIVWTYVAEAKQLNWTTSMPFGSQKVASCGEMHFSGSETCEIAFWSEITKLPKALPAPMVHKMTAVGIRKFFSGLKAQVETANAPVT